MKINKLVIVLVFIWTFIFTHLVKASNNDIREPSVMGYITSIDYDEEVKKIGHPYSLYIEKIRNEMVLIDSQRSKITIYRLDNFYPVLTLDYRWGIQSPIQAQIDRKGNVYILHVIGKDLYELAIYDRALIKKSSLNFSGSIKPQRFAISSEGKIYVLVQIIGENFNSDSQIFIYDAEGNKIGDFDFTNLKDTIQPTEIKIDLNDNIYLIDLQKGKIFVFNKNHQFLFSFGEKGGVTGKLSQPKSIDIDEKRGIAYIVDYMRHVVNVYDLKNEGRYLFEFGGYGYDIGWFQFPSCVSLDIQGRVYVADTLNKRVQVLSPYEGKAGLINPLPKNRVVKDFRELLERHNEKKITQDVRFSENFLF